MNTKDKILKSALKLFAKNGIDKTSTKKITKDAGIAEGTLFVHFSTKQELIDSLYLDIKRKMLIESGVGIDPKKSVEKNIRETARLFIDYLSKHSNEMIFMELIEKDPQISDTARSEAQRTYEETTKTLKQWIKQGALKKVEYELLHDTLWNMMLAMAKYCKDNKKKVNDRMLNMIWGAIRR